MKTILKLKNSLIIKNAKQMIFYRKNNKIPKHVTQKLTNHCMALIVSTNRQL